MTAPVTQRQRFDNLARAVAEGRLTRRGVWHVLGGGALVTLGVTAPADAARDIRRPNRSYQCVPSNKICTTIPIPKKPGKKTRKVPMCHRCCGTFRPHPSFENAGVCCTPNGGLCESAAECCLGECIAGTCQNSVVQLPTDPSAGSAERSPDGGAVSVGDTMGGGAGGSCRQYGETCTTAEDCCPLQDGSRIPCVGGTCRFN